MNTLLKKLGIYFCCIFILLFFLFPYSVQAESSEITTYSPACLLMEASTGKVIYEKNAHTRMYPASTTKIMTAILVLENGNLADTVTVSENAVLSIPNGYSTAQLQIGEQLTVEQLLYALMLPSANDAAVALAEYIAGSVDSFAAMMNTKAVEIGCTDTHFVNPNGVHDENHYSTAYDLALMGQYAMQNTTFRSIVSTTQFSLPITNKYPTADRIYHNNNLLLSSSLLSNGHNYYYPYCTGIKTGYTDSAKSCIVASAKKDNMELIAVVLGGETLENGLSGRFLDCQTLFDYGFNNYSFHTILEKSSVVQETEIINGTEETRNLELLAENDLTVFAKNDVDLESITPTISITNHSAPISKSSIVGTVSYTVDGETFSTNLLAASNVDVSKVMENVLKVVIAIFLIFLAILILLPKKDKKKKRK